LTSPCEVTFEGLYLRAVSPGVIKTLMKTLSNSADPPPTLTQVGVDANIRRRICRGSGGADHSMRVAPHELGLATVDTIP